MGSPDCPYNLRASLTVIQHAFHDSVGDGFRAIGEEVNNAFSRGREVLTPNKPFPDLEYEIVNNRLHWAGDRLSVVHHLRRYIVWLRANGGTETQLDQARLDLKAFRKIQRLALGLSNGNAVMWLAQKTTGPTDGVALQQIRKQGDKLIQSSQLLPFDQQSQIDIFQDQIGQNRDDVSIDDSVGGWIVQGEALDFTQDLPGLVKQARQPVVLPEAISEAMTLREPVTYTTIVRSIGEVGLAEASFTPDVPVSVSEAAGFWFEVMAAVAAPAVIETSVPEYSVENTSRFGPAVSEIPAAPVAAADAPNVVETPTPVFVVNEPALRFEPEASMLSEETTRIIPVGSQKGFEQEKPSFVRVDPAVQPGVEAVVVRAIWPMTEENLAEQLKAPKIKEEAIIYQARTKAEEVGEEIEQLEPTEQPLRERLPALEVESWSTVEAERTEEAAESVVSENQDKSLILPMTKMMVESEQEKLREDQVDQEAEGETVRIETMPHRDKTVLPIWEIKMQGISLDDIPEWNLSSVLVGEDLGWSMTVPGLKAERELGTNAERAFKLGKWPEFDYLKKTAEVVETILSVIVNTNWEQPPLIRRRMVKDFGGDWGSGSAKYRQIQR